MKPFPSTDPRIPKLDIRCDHSAVYGTPDDAENVFCCAECCPNPKAHNEHPRRTYLTCAETIALHREWAAESKRARTVMRRKGR